MKKIINSVLSLPKKAVLLISNTVTLGIKKLFFGLPFVFVGAFLGYNLGQQAYLFHAPNPGSYVFISGQCNLEDGRPKKESLVYDAAILVSNNEKRFSASLVKTREFIICDKEVAALHTTPLIKAYAVIPEPVKEIQVQLPPKTIPQYINRTFLVSGTCSGRDISEVFMTIQDAKNDNGDTVVVGKTERGEVLECKNPVLVEAKKDEGALPVELEEDLTGKRILVTSTCFPHNFLPKKSGEQVFYALVNSPVQVISYKRINKKITHLVGAFLEKGVMIECFEDKFPIVYRKYTDDIVLSKPSKPSQD